MTSEQLAKRQHPCKFSSWTFDPTDGQLLSKNKSIRLQPRIALLLSIFLANSGKLLSREQLIDCLWKDKAVNEDALSRCIAELRSILGDNSASPIYIETVPKKGYKFLVTVSEKSLKSNFKRATAIILFLVLSLIVVFNNQSPPSNDLSTKLQNAIINAKRLTTDTVYERLPVLSDNGAMLAFSVIFNNRLIIKVINQNNEQLFLIKNDDYQLYAPRFTPDNNAITVAGIHSGSCKILHYQLPSLTVESLGNCKAQGLASLFDWSEDQSKLFYVAPTDIPKQSAIWMYLPASQNHIKLTNPELESLFDSGPKLSPDEKSLIFTRGTHSYREIYLLNLKTSEVEQLTNDKGFISGLNWFNDNQHLILDSDELGDRHLWLFNIKTKSKQLLGAKDSQYPSMDGSNSLLSYQEVRYNANIWSLDLINSNSKIEPLIESIKYNNNPVFSPNGQRIAFSSNRTGKSSIWLYDMKTGLQENVFSLQGHDSFMPYWSTDNKRLIVSTRNKEGYRCYSVSLSDFTYQPLININRDHASCIEDADGNIFAVTKNQSEPAELLKIKTNGEVISLIESHVKRVELGDNNTLIYSLLNKDGLFAINTDGSNQRVLVETFKAQFDDHWTVRNNYLYYLQSESGIWRINLSSSEKENVTSELPSAIGLTLNVNADHSKLLITKTESRKVDVYFTQLDL